MAPAIDTSIPDTIALVVDAGDATDASTPDVSAVVVDAGGATDLSSPDLTVSVDAVMADGATGDASIGVDNALADVATAADTWVPDAALPPLCGDRQVQAPETCDDGNLIDGDGCSASCTTEPGWSCPVDGVMGSVCREICGDGRIVGAELCDGDNHNGETCTSLGYLESAVSLVCSSDCRSFNTSLCEPAIVCSTLERAITEAYAAPGHEVISIQPDTCNLNAVIVLDECASGSCPPTGPDGITLRSLSGDVVFYSAINKDCLLIETGHNIIEGLTFSDCHTAIQLDDPYTNSGSNTVRHNRIINTLADPGIAMRIYSPSNTVIHNWIENQFHLNGNKGFSVRGDSNRLALNVVKGNYNTGIFIKAHKVTVDSNTFWIEYSGAVNQGPVIKLDTATNLCFRDNMVIAPTVSSIYVLKVNVSFAPLSHCFPASSNNLVPSNGSPLCDGGTLLCNQHCNNGGPLCDVQPTAAPNVNANACLEPGDPAVDMGRDLGYDRVEGSSKRFLGIDPDLGALESGAAYTFGDQSFVCP